jgi:hypothetical protein
MRKPIRIPHPLKPHRIVNAVLRNRKKKYYLYFRK